MGNRKIGNVNNSSYNISGFSGEISSIITKKICFSLLETNFLVWFFVKCQEIERACVFIYSFCPRRGLPRSSATILIDLVCLFVCLSAIPARFTEWYLHRLQTQIPLGVLTRGFSEGPEKTSFKSGLKRFPGPCFLSLFLKNRHLENALP